MLNINSYTCILPLGYIKGGSPSFFSNINSIIITIVTTIINSASRPPNTRVINIITESIFPPVYVAEFGKMTLT